LKSATDLGEAVALAGLQLVFGGGAEGIMCALTDAALASGGRVLGIIPEFLIELEGLHPGPQRIIRTETLQDRKRAMYEHADAFVALPGGLGTLDEVLEVITWRQIALHDKPIVIVNVRGWADAFIATLEAAKASGFAGDETLHLFEVVPDVAAVLPRLGVSAGRGGAR
jgi:hypothetical protein